MKVHLTPSERSFIMITTQTWCPVFPGFYSTYFESDICEDNLTEDMNERNIDPKERDRLIEGLFNTKVFASAVKEQRQATCESVVNTIHSELTRLNLVKRIKFEELRSPKYYNFGNDSINIEVTFTKKNVNSIKKMIKENMDLWTEYLKDRYTSRSGFISHYSNSVTDWNIDEAIQDPHKCGAVLEFICQLEDIDEDLLLDRNNSYISIDIDALIEELKEV